MSSVSIRQHLRERELFSRLSHEVVQKVRSTWERLKRRSQVAVHMFQATLQAEARYKHLCDNFKLANSEKALPVVGYLISLSSAEAFSLHEGENVWTISERGSLQRTEGPGAYTLSVKGNHLSMSTEGAEDLEVVCNEILNLGGQRFILKMIPPSYRKSTGRAV